MAERTKKFVTAPENTNEETLLVSYTCGMCETICVKDELINHPCFDGYNKVYVVCSSSSGRGSRNKMRCLSITDDSVNGTLQQLADFLGQPVAVDIPVFNLPRPPSADKAALFANLVAAQLREVHPHFMDDIMLELMKVLNAAKRKKL